MSSDSERLLKPTKRHRQIVSDSGSSDDEFMITNQRRKCRVVSEEDSTDDDSDIPLHPIQRKKNHKILSEDESSSCSSSCDDGAKSYFSNSSTSSEWQSDWESMDESDHKSIKSSCSAKCKKLKNKSVDKNKSASTHESENSDGESDNCPICLISFRKQEIASPASCDHCFCLDCLIEWSKNVNTCPVDRQTFTSINVRSKIGGQIVRHIPVEAKSLLDDAPPEDPTYCEVCQQCDREDRMLLCDGCDSGYHLECLDPPLDEVPLEEQWYCWDCSVNATNDAEDIDIDLDEVPDLMEEARQLGLIYGRSRASVIAQNSSSSVRSSGRRSRMLPRTRQTERVLALVRRSRDSAAAAIRERSNRPTTSTSSGFDSISENSRSRSPVAGPSGSASRRRPAAALARKRTVKSKSRSSGKRKCKSRAIKRVVKRRAPTVREVRVPKINENGDLEEIVTYVKESKKSKSRKSRSGGPVPSGRRKKRRKKLRRRVRTVASVAEARRTAKRRIAAQLKIAKPSRFMGDATPLIPIMKGESGPTNSSVALRLARSQAGISQLSLFGNELGLDYSPPGFNSRKLGIANGTVLILTHCI